MFDEPDDRLGNGRARRQRSRAIHHEYGVRLIGAEQDLQGAPVALGVGITDDVDRIAVRPCGRQNSVERPKRGFGELGQVAIQISKPIGRQDAGPTAIGENGKPVAVERGWRARISAALKSSSSSRTRSTPARRNAAS